MKLKSGRQLNEMDTFFFGYSKVKTGQFRFAGCFECADPGIPLDQLKSSIERVIENLKEVFVIDPKQNHRPKIETKSFESEREQRDFYGDCLSRPVDFGNVLLRVFFLNKADGSRAIFLLIPHFAGDSKIAIFVLQQIMGSVTDAVSKEPLQFVSYRQMARDKMRGPLDMGRSLVTEAGEMADSFTWTSPKKGKMDIATRFLEDDEFKMINRARRTMGLSRSMLLQVVVLHAYRELRPHRLSRVFNIIYDNTPPVSTVNNCFRSMPLVIPGEGAELTLEASRDLFTSLLTRYESPVNRHAFLFRSFLAEVLPLSVIRRIFARTTRGVQHYISYVFLTGKLHLPSNPKGGHRIWGNIEPVGYSLSNFNVVEFEKQISLNVTWDTASLGESFGDELLNRIVGIFDELEKRRFSS